MSEPTEQQAVTLSRRLVLAQIDIEAGRIDENLAKLQDVALAHRHADLVVFPELVLQGHLFAADRKASLDLLHEHPAEPRTLARTMHEFALDNDIRILYGELDVEGDKLYNFATYVGSGRIQRYAKTHVHWSEHFEAGGELRAFDTATDRIGVLICFDAAFPEAARVLALQGARVIACIAAVPRSFPTAIMHHRMRSIAVMNQVFSVYVNRAGADFGGGSAVFSPLGETVAELGEGEEVRECTIELAELFRWRSDEPALVHRRPELYGPIVHTPELPAVEPDRPAGDDLPPVSS
jgi:N-carbamoylputrescine amidase